MTVTREMLAEAITSVLLAVQDHEPSECNPKDVAIMIDLLRCACVLLANDDFDFVTLADD